MIDIVTVVFEPEISVLRLQAQSIDLYCRDLGIRNIYVVVNDQDSVAQQIDPAWWGEFADRVTVLPRRVFSAQYASNGWVSQQALKILAASISYNVWSMVLDAKTIFIKPVDLVQLIDQDGRVQAGSLDIYPVFESSRQLVNQFYGIDLDQQLGPGGVPFLFHNRTVRSLISHAETQTQTNFVDWFQSQGLLTEFILYSGYVKYLYQNFDALYSPTCNLHPNNICHSEVGIFDQKLNQASHSDVDTVSVHRNAWSQLTTQQQHTYREFLIGRGITSAENL
jgi:Family of unknown function (DUF6492)